MIPSSLLYFAEVVVCVCVVCVVVVVFIYIQLALLSQSHQRLEVSFFHFPLFVSKKNLSKSCFSF